MSRPSPILKLLFDVPAHVYHWQLGWLLGHRFLMVNHRGRTTGTMRETVLEVLNYDPASEESIVASAYGANAQWYRNIHAYPAIRVRTGRLDYTPQQRFLDPDETRDVAATYCRSHPWAARLAPRLLDAIGAVDRISSAPAVDLLGAMPMVAFRPGD